MRSSRGGSPPCTRVSRSPRKRSTSPLVVVGPAQNVPRGQLREPVERQLARVDRPDERLVLDAVAPRCGRNTAIPGSSLTCQSACSPSPRYGGAGSRTGESCAMASTQDALYSEIDLDLSWSERDLPERERTKHVHRLHPYLGKFIPQLAETLLERYVARGGHVLDPFAGSGTTLVQGLESGFEATGVDIAAFNCLLMRVKTQPYNLFVLERELREVVSRLDDAAARAKAPRYLRDWFAPQAAQELLTFRDLVVEYEHRDVLRV